MGNKEKALTVRVAALAIEDGQFTFQIFTVCGEPQTFQIGTERYMTPTDAAQAGYEATALMRS
jgi:hypothetical protein